MSRIVPVLRRAGGVGLHAIAATSCHRGFTDGEHRGTAGQFADAKAKASYVAGFGLVCRYASSLGLAARQYTPAIGAAIYLSLIHI